jgi:glycosyltransferase involved in cell wall biosynthesis
MADRVRHVVHVLTVPESLAFLRGQPTFMRLRGYRSTVITSPGAGLEAFGEREGVPTHSVPMPRRVSPTQDARSLAQLVALLRRLRPDIVHAHTPKGGLLGTIAATLARVPVRVYHMRGLPLVTAHGAQRAILTATERTSCALASRVVAVSTSLRDVALAERLCAAKKITVLAGGSGNGIDCDRFDPARVGPGARRDLRERLAIPESALVIGFVGRLVRDKGVVELAEAFMQVKTQHPSVHLVLAGVFEERDPVPADTRRALEGDPRVHLLGFVEDTSSLYPAIDVLALPTYREGFPNVPLEAAAMEVPVVATRVPGCVDAVADGETGILVPARDATALARALDVYLADPALRLAHGRAGRVRVGKSFQRERIWEALANLYDELLLTS